MDNHLKTNLLGLPSITTLNLAARMEITSLDQALTEEVIRKKFPKVFQGPGNLGEEYDIKL